jgi:hypothetical protein
MPNKLDPTAPAGDFPVDLVSTMPSLADYVVETPQSALQGGERFRGAQTEMSVPPITPPG